MNFLGNTGLDGTVLALGMSGNGNQRAPRAEPAIIDCADSLVWPPQQRGLSDA
jgi:hypothetical protein